MSHIEIHEIKRRKYKYEVTNYRTGKNIKHKWKYLGPVEPLNKRRNPNAGRKPEIFIKPINEKELKTLETATKSNDAFTRDREKILTKTDSRKSKLRKKKSKKSHQGIQCKKHCCLAER